MVDARQHPSNIGVRRQHTTLTRLDQPGSSLSRNKTEGPGAKALRDPQRARLDRLKRPVSSRDAHDDTGGIYGRTVQLSDDNKAIVLALKHDSTRQSESDEDSPPALLVNPSIEVLPVARTAHAQGIFDFYVNSYATSIIEVSPQNTAPYSQIVHQILHDELLFTAFTTCSEAARWRTQTLYDDAPLSVVRGYGRTITLLTKRLQSERFAMSPTIILTMSQLVAIETMIKNVSATARHLAGMQAAMRPGGQSQASKETAPVQTAVDVWTRYFIQRSVVKGSIPRTEPLKYPKHPFDPKTSVLIASLPVGFLDIALSGRVSTVVLNLMSRFQVYFTKINDWNKIGALQSEERTQVILEQAAWCIEFHQVQTLSVVERVIVTALTSYVARRDRIHPALVNIRGYYQITCAYLVNILSSTGGLLQEDQDSDLVVWTGLLLLLTSTPEAHARKLALKLLPRRPEPVKLLQKCQNFFWDEDLTDALLLGKVLSTTASNDVVANNIKQSLPDAVRQDEGDA